MFSEALKGALGTNREGKRSCRKQNPPDEGKSDLSDSPAVSSPPGDTQAKGRGRQRLVRAGQGGLEDPCVGWEKDQNSSQILLGSQSN